MKKYIDLLPGILICFIIALIAFKIGNIFPILGGPIIAILLGMIIHFLLKKPDKYKKGLTFTSKKILQLSIILLGFSLNINLIITTGYQSLPLIIISISVALLVVYLLYKKLKPSKNSAILVGVGSAICGASAIAATSSIIKADDKEIAQALSVIVLFNVIAALIFPALGLLLNFNPDDVKGFAMFAGSAINDTSSVTAAASTWDNIHNLNTQTLDTAISVKLTRTLAIIPIVVGLSFIQNKNNSESKKVNIFKTIPLFIILFLLASLFISTLSYFNIDISIFDNLKVISKFLIIMAMAAIGLSNNVFTLFNNNKQTILIGFLCWISIIITSLIVLKVMGIL